MQRSAYQRTYVMLRPASGQAAGTARIETQRGRYRIWVRASHLPEQPVRAMLLAGEAETGAVYDLGLMRRTGSHQAVLFSEGSSLKGAYHTLAVAADWPDAELLLYGRLMNRPDCTLWQTRQAVARYLRLPAADSAPAPAKVPPAAPKLSVLRLRSRVPT